MNKPSKMVLLHSWTKHFEIMGAYSCIYGTFKEQTIFINQNPTAKHSSAVWILILLACFTTVLSGCVGKEGSGKSSPTFNKTLLDHTVRVCIVREWT